MGWRQKCTDWMTDGPPVTPAVYAERGYTMTVVGYTSAPWDIHPDDLYVRVPAAPLFDRVYQGVQKDNALSQLQYASNHPGMGPDIASIERWSPYMTNPMQHQAAGQATAQKNPAHAYGLIGPGTPWAPNPTQPGAAYGPSQPSGLWSAILARLGLRSSGDAG
jgi:hypothetical protein